MSEKLKIVYRPLQELSPYAHNARTHSPEQVAQLVESIKQFGWTNPVLIDEKGEIIAGHGRVMAAEMLKMDSVPVIVLSGLTDEQKKAYRLADNRLPMNAGWDEDLLRMELSDLINADFDVSLTGFIPTEIDELLTDVLPGMRGWTIKGKPASGRAVLSQEQDGIKSHTHSASASSTDLGTKTTSSFDYGTKSTNNTGAHHTHSLSGSTNAAGNHSHRDGRRFNPSVFKDTYQYGYTSSGQNTWGVQGSVGMSTGALANTSTDGNHSHSLSGTAASAGAHAHTVGIGAHTHSVAIGSHGHTITVNAAGNAENTVKNIAFNYIVRLA
ncbi:TPA: ParB N-terminal domain-containing protein [Escherichia coli]|uniref:ParB/Srx family N-terminal domain-containing protein n=2 Tax=Enterobacteriaceae TaxID=543 RepID=UPI00198E13CE|nr:ParB N-terminal domain-containing protein [Escherichia coli]